MEERNYEYDYSGKVYNGFAMLFVTLVIIPAAIAAVLLLSPDLLSPWPWVSSIALFIVFIIMLCGFFIQQPNQARVMIFFGKYRGTFRSTGYYWVNPFMGAKKVSLRIRNLDVAPIKVNDKTGNPVMIGMVLVWKVRDTYRVIFDVDTDLAEPQVTTDASGNVTIGKQTGDALSNFVKVQSDAALREVTGHYAYDDEDNRSDQVTLRSGSHEIVERLEEKLNERLSMAGIEVVEARLNYLAYAPEIAAVMLRRQQASAIISAREKIVEGAVSMVKMALTQLKDEGVVDLDEERKATMVSNLLVVLCADEPAQPVVNTGTLYN
ncbi:MAG: SPFH domain-containing protein [Barnesiella sp.]|nr:SPFH domain-containing protein [Barnesiella sp.]MBD5254109.1 SPFH domain-containing protein [Barnesiella sp.]MBD5343951.1 SPFH domain-containing protein [Bacteroides sp.]MDE5828781.1 SPFH domain-containing protein [Duncaniella sp.]